MSYRIGIHRQGRGALLTSVITVATVGCSTGATEPGGNPAGGGTGNSSLLDPNDPGGGADGTGSNDSVDMQPDAPPPSDGPVDGVPPNDDLGDPGDPAAKRSYLIGLEEAQGPADHF